MDRHTVIFTADKRLSDLGTLLTGRRVSCSWDEYRRKTGSGSCAEYVYVLPTPVSKLENCRHIKRQLKEELTVGKVICVFGGMFDEEWKAFFRENHIPFVDFLEVEAVVALNAQITAEAVLAEILQLSPWSVKGQKIMVTGFGACARPIAEKLSDLGADITVVARSSKARRKARESGYRTCDFSTWNQIVGTANTIVNTVPALVVTKEIIEKMSKETMILDIASKPGGTDFESAKECQISTKLALGLPGIYSTKSSALALRSAMWEYAPLQDLKRGEQSWIFQIII